MSTTAEERLVIDTWHLAIVSGAWPLLSIIKSTLQLVIKAFTYYYDNLSVVNIKCTLNLDNVIVPSQSTDYLLWNYVSNLSVWGLKTE